SAVLVVPKWTDTWWWQLTKNMKVLAEYPAGVSMFSMAPLKEGGPWIDMKAPTWATVVLWDPPAVTQQHNSCTDEHSPQIQSDDHTQTADNCGLLPCSNQLIRLKAKCCGMQLSVL